MLALLWRLPGGSRGPAIQRLLESRSARRRRLEGALRQPAQTVVFVCHGNIMRSAFAAAWARAHSAGMGAEILSAGTHATSERHAQASAIAVAEALGCPLLEHRATPLSEIRPADDVLFVCMDLANEANTMARFRAHAHRVFLIGDVLFLDRAAGLGGMNYEIRDPYGRGDEVTRIAFEAIQTLVDRWAAVAGVGQGV